MEPLNSIGYTVSECCRISCVQGHKLDIGFILLLFVKRQQDVGGVLDRFTLDTSHGLEFTLGMSLNKQPPVVSLVCCTVGQMLHTTKLSVQLVLKALVWNST